jgi:hypothetical protein
MRKMLTGEKHQIYVLKYDNEITEKANYLANKMSQF